MRIKAAANTCRTTLQASLIRSFAWQLEHGFPADAMDVSREARGPPFLSNEQLIHPPSPFAKGYSSSTCTVVLLIFVFFSGGVGGSTAFTSPHRFPIQEVKKLADVSYREGIGHCSCLSLLAAVKQAHRWTNPRGAGRVLHTAPSRTSFFPTQ